MPVGEASTTETGVRPLSRSRDATACEEPADIEATYEHVKACSPDTFFTTVSYPIKGTPYFEEVASKLVQLREWGATTDREVRIRGRHSRRYYQLADQLLRSQSIAEADAVRQRMQEAYSEVEA